MRSMPPSEPRTPPRRRPERSCCGRSSRESASPTALKRLGIEVEYDYPNRYSVDEAKIWLRNTPFDLNPILKKHGFRWGSGRNGKGWWIAMREYTAILNKLVADIFRRCLSQQSQSLPWATGVFSDMRSPRTLSVARSRCGPGHGVQRGLRR